MDTQYRWLNEPQSWSLDKDVLSVVTDANTDFWQKTWYGFERFSGHIFAREVAGDFTFQVRVRADFTTLYDQAGIMFMADEKHWLKAGIEFNDDAPAIGSVLTLGHSDWATGVFPGEAKEFWMRLTRKKDSLRLQYSTDGQQWPLLRLSFFPAEREKCFVGVMCCTPERGGLAVHFDNMQLTPALDKNLHDLT